MQSWMSVKELTDTLSEGYPCRHLHKSDRVIRVTGCRKDQMDFTCMHAVDPCHLYKMYHNCQCVVRKEKHALIKGLPFYVSETRIQASLSASSPVKIIFQAVVAEEVCNDTIRCTSNSICVTFKRVTWVVSAESFWVYCCFAALFNEILVSLFAVIFAFDQIIQYTFNKHPYDKLLHNLLTEGSNHF